MRSIIFILFMGILAGGYAQDSVLGGGSVLPDTMGLRDSLRMGDTVIEESKHKVDSNVIWQEARRVVIGQSGLSLTAPGWFFLQREKEEMGRERVFYYILALLLFFGALKLSYPRYFTDAYRFYFQSTLRINQVKEQLSHAVAASIFFNLLFFLSAGAYLYLMAEYYQLSFRINIVWLPIVTFILLLLIYGGKYVFLMVIGWAFDLKKAASAYLFITYLTNKLIGVALLPLLSCIAFMPKPYNDFFVTISFVVLISFYSYRLFRAYQPVHDEFKIGFWQYILYLLAFEIVPLLLIYKLLIQIL
ncbi:MAG: DUF4271 domain-containing protein [Bacteroidota bacterium]